MGSLSKDAFQALLEHPRLWRGREFVAEAGVVSTGYPRLDAQLPGRGWRRGTLTEIAVEHYGTGELGLLIPALGALSRGERWLAWVAPPFIPYAPALAAAGIDLSRVVLVHPATETDVLWATGQALRTGACAAVLAWAGRVPQRELRRLQLAAEAGDSWGVMFRSPQDFAGGSPAALRLKLIPDGRRLKVEIVKARGGRPGTVRLTPVTGNE